MDWNPREFFPGNMHACGASQGHRDMRAAHEKENNKKEKKKGKQKERTERQNLEFHALVERILLVDNLVIVVIEFLKT
jgi:hypothetical protein